MGSMMFNAEKHLQKSNEKRETCSHIFVYIRNPIGPRERSTLLVESSTIMTLQLVAKIISIVKQIIWWFNMPLVVVANCGDLHIAPENGLPKRKFIFQPLIFRGHVNFREGIQTMSFCHQGIKVTFFPQGWSVWRRAMMAKFPRKCNGNAHCWSSCNWCFGGQVLTSKKRMEFDLVVLAVAIVYIDWVSSNAFVCICQCGMLDFCELRPVAFTIFEEFHVTSSSSSVPFA